MDIEKKDYELITRGNQELKQQPEDIAEFKERIQDEFSKLKKIAGTQQSQTDIDRVKIGLLPAGVLAKKLGISLDFEDIISEVRDTTTPLNPESRSNLGMAIGSMEEINYKHYFGDLKSPHAKK